MKVIHPLALLVFLAVGFTAGAAAADEKPNMPSWSRAAAKAPVGKRLVGAVLVRAGEKRIAKGEADRAFVAHTEQKANGAIKAARGLSSKERLSVEKEAAADVRYAKNVYAPRGESRIATGNAMVRAGSAMRGR